MEEQELEANDAIIEAGIILNANTLRQFMSTATACKEVKIRIKDLLEKAVRIDVAKFPILEQAVLSQYLHNTVKNPEDLFTDLKWTLLVGIVLGKEGVDG